MANQKLENLYMVGLFHNYFITKGVWMILISNSIPLSNILNVNFSHSNLIVTYSIRFACQCTLLDLSTIEPTKINNSLAII